MRYFPFNLLLAQLDDLCCYHKDFCGDHLYFTIQITMYWNSTQLGQIHVSIFNKSNIILFIPGVSCHNDPWVNEETGSWDLASPGGCFFVISKKRKWFFCFKLFLAHFKESREWKCIFVILDIQESESEFVAFTIELIVDMAESESACLLSGPS